MKKNKIISIVIVLLLTISIIGCSNDNNQVYQNNKNDTLKIGFIGPMSGQYAQMGISNAQSAKLASKDFKNIEIIIEDDQFDPKLTVNAYQKLKNVDEIDALVVMTTPGIEALKPLIEQDKIPTVVLGQDLNVKKDYVFHIAESIFLPYVELGKDMKKYDNSVFLIGESSWRDEVVANYKLGYGEDAKVIYFNEDDSAATTVLKMESGNYTAFSIDATPKAWIPLYNRIDDLNLDQKMEHILNYNEEGNFRAGSFKDKVPDEFFEGKKVVTIESGSNSDKEFMERYKKNYGEDLTFFGDFGYDAVKLFVKSDPREGNWIENTQNHVFTGVTGEIRFDENGDRIPVAVRGYIHNSTLVVTS